MGILIEIIFFVGYYAFISYCLRYTDIVRYLRRFTYRECVQSMFIQILGVFFILREVNLNHVVYFYDAFITWGPSLWELENIIGNPSGVLQELYRGINCADYNGFVSMIMLLPMSILGKTFDMYVVTGWILFFIPASIVASFAVQSTFDRIGFPMIPSPVLQGIFLLIPAVSSPMFFGYIYVSGLLPAAVMYFLFLNINWQHTDVNRFVLIAILSCLLLIQNRVFGYYVLAFALGMLVYGGMELWGQGSSQNKKRVLFSIIKGYLLWGFIDLFILCTLFWRFFKRSVLNNHETSYIGYRFGNDYFQALGLTCDYFGVVIISFVVLGFVVGWRCNAAKKYATSLAVMLLVPILLISRILVMNNHHMYDILIPIFCFISLFISFAFGKNRKIAKALCAILLANFLYAYSGIAHPLPHLGNVHHPMVRDDTEDIQAMVFDINNIKPKDKSLYVNACGNSLNDDIFRKAKAPYSLEAITNQQGNAQVDLRDGFFTNFFDADYVVVCNPVQIHMLPQDQRVITVINENMMGDTLLSKHYALVKTYELIPDYKNKDRKDEVRLYKKISPITVDTVSDIERQFDELYPDHPNLFHDRFEKYKDEKGMR